MTKSSVATETETELIRRAALDYFEGWFDGDVERIDRALHPDIVKRSPGKEHGAALGITTKERMLELTAAGAGAEDGVDRRLEVEIEDVYGDIDNALWRPT